MRRGLVLFPPGWGLDVGGPHLAPLLLKGFSAVRGICIDVRDVNVEAARHVGAYISDEDVRLACADPTLEAMNVPYFRAQAVLDAAARPFGGGWSMRDGFVHADLDPAQSASVHGWTERRLPYTGFLETAVIPEALEADLVALSVAVPGQLLGALHIAHLLRARGFRGRVLLGGNAVTRLGADLAQDWVFNLVDGFVPFGGELAMVAAMEAEGEWRREVPGLVWRSAGKVEHNPVRHLEASQFAEPSYPDRAALDRYWGVRYLTTVGFRGCYFGKCSFCAIPYGWGPEGRLGLGDPKRLSSSLKQATEATGLHRVKFVDEAMHPGFLREALSAFERDDLDIAFEAYARLDPWLVDGALVERAARRGLRKLLVGLEIAPGTSRGLLGKDDPASPSRALRILADQGVRTHLFCMFGFPGTDAGDALRTAEFLLEHRDLIDTVDIAAFQLERHTEVTGARRLPNPTQDWALRDDFELIGPGMKPSETAAIAAEIEDLLWQEQPSWLHPIYRMGSPWL